MAPLGCQSTVNELKTQTGKNKHYDIHLSKLFDELSNTQNMEMRSRYLTEQMALALQACSLLATSIDNDNALIDIAHTFCESRLGNGSGFALGTLPDTTPFEKIIALGRVS